MRIFKPFYRIRYMENSLIQHTNQKLVGTCDRYKGRLITARFVIRSESLTIIELNTHLIYLSYILQFLDNLSLTFTSLHGMWAPQIRHSSRVRSTMRGVRISAYTTTEYSARDVEPIRHRGFELFCHFGWFYWLDSTPFDLGYVWIRYPFCCLH